MSNDAESPVTFFVVLAIIAAVFIGIGFGFDQITCWLDGGTWTGKACIR